MSIYFKYIYISNSKYLKNYLYHKFLIFTPIITSLINISTTVSQGINSQELRP